MVNKIKGRFPVVFIILVILLLTISYSSNLFYITDNDYKFFDKSDEGNVISRLMMSRNEGILSKGGLTGNYSYYQYKLKEGDDIPTAMSLILDGTIDKIEDLDYRTIVAQRYDDYINDRETFGGTYLTYKTQPGGQAFIFVILDQVIPLDSSNKLVVFRLITIILSALVFGLFVRWVLNNFGWTEAIVLFLLIFLSPWLFRFAYNLWWALWSYYIPFITMLFVLDWKRKKGNPKLDKTIYSLLVITVFAKFFFTGAEFISSTLVMTICPIIYHLLITEKDIKKSISYLIKSSVACVLGILLGMILLIAQIRLLEGTWGAGLNHIILSFVKRTAYGEQADTFEFTDVLTMYFTEKLFYHRDFPFFSISFGAACLFISIVSIIVLRLSKKRSKEIYLRNKALVVTTAVSISGPLSWIIIFPEHAYTHSMIDYIVWYMPYLLYGFCTIGVFIQLIISLSRQNKEILTKPVQ